jgi:hypothetical protein
MSTIEGFKRQPLDKPQPGPMVLAHVLAYQPIAARQNLMTWGMLAVSGFCFAVFESSPVLLPCAVAIPLPPSRARFPVALGCLL